MELQYKVILSNKKIYKEIILPFMHKTVTVGSKIDCDVRMPQNLFFEAFSLIFRMDAGEWKVACDGRIYISSNAIDKYPQLKLQHGHRYYLKYESSNAEFLTMDFEIDFDSVVCDYDLSIDIKNQSKVVIGGKKNSNILIRSEFVGEGCIVLSRQGTKILVCDVGTPFGVFVNGARITNDCELHDYDFFSVAYYSFFYKRGKLYTAKKNKLIINDLQTKDMAEQKSCLTYPQFNRNSRVITVLNEEPISVLEAPEKPQEPKENLLISLFPAVAMVILTIMMKGAMGGSSYIVFSVCSMGLGVVTSLMTFFTNKKQYKKDCEHRIAIYNDYIERKRNEIQEERTVEKQKLQEIYLDHEAEMQLVRTFSSHLFDRGLEDSDFGSVYLGTGLRKSVRKIDFKKQEKIEAEDSLSLLPVKLSKEFEEIEKAPITLSLIENDAVGIIGTLQNCISMLKNITYDLAVRHYPDDLRMYFVCDESNVCKIDWVRWLPHIKNQRLGINNLICDSASKNLLFEDLFIQLSNTDSKEENESYTSYNVVFILDDMGFMEHPVSQYVHDAKRKGFCFVFFAADEGLLPKNCESIIRLDTFGKNGVLIEAKNNLNSVEFTYQTVSDKDVEQMAYKMSPVFCEEVSLEGGLLKNYSFYQMMNIFDAEEISLGQNWNSDAIYHTLKAPLGINAKKEMVYLDLHENAHGPHGLVAGTTGSGKSEILQSYIISMAINYHPDDVGFVIIDFKGGGMANQFASLPHLIGTITNIDGREIERSLKAIRAELQKRQRLFAEYNVNKIDSYIMKYKNGEAKVALPHLIIVVDEFAELKADQPEFMKELISAARIGRSLGVHLILATQKPAGQVDDQIWSNSKFKLCLKVQDKEDSNEVLKSPLAAEIREPGRAYLQVGNNEIFMLFQSAYSGGSSCTDEGAGIHEFELAEVNKWGQRTIVFQQKKSKSKIQTNVKSQLEAIVEYIQAYCIRNDIAKLPSICMPSLEDVVNYPRDVEKLPFGCVNLGIYDDPENQIQDKVILDISTKNTFILGSSQYGKTNLLQGIIRSVMQTMTTEEANIYILDFGSMILKNFAESNHVGGVVCSNEDEKLKNLFKLIESEISIRKEKLASAGVSSYVAYRDAGYTDIPQIYLIIDNLTALMELYLEDDDTLLVFIREGAAVGITTIVANSQTAGVSYKYLANFSNKIVLYCNDSSEYNNIFDHVSMQPKEVPGRCIFEMEKRMLECQTYLSFEGEKEIERVSKIKELIENTNSISSGRKAISIPYIPAILPEKTLFEDYRLKTIGYSIPIGLTYAEVEPFFLKLNQLGAIGICGREGSGHKNFIDYIMKCLQRGKTEYPVEVCIIDDITYKFKRYQESEIVTEYIINPERVTDILADYHMRLSERYQMLLDGESLDKQPLLLMVIQNNDVARIIAEDMTAQEQYSEILSRYKALNVCFIYANYTNTSVSYDAPEPLHMIKEEQHLLLLDNLADLKVFEPDYEALRRYKKKVSTGDAYYIQGNNIEKIKIVSSGM